MAHFAQLDENNVVTQVIVADSKEWCESVLGGVWVQTSYNTTGGVHYGKNGQPDGQPALHKNYAGIGYHFDGVGFYAPQPYPSWSLNQDTYFWEAPVPMPVSDSILFWNEDTQSWTENQA